MRARLAAACGRRSGVARASVFRFGGASWFWCRVGRRLVPGSSRVAVVRSVPVAGWLPFRCRLPVLAPVALRCRRRPGPSVRLRRASFSSVSAVLAAGCSLASVAVASRCRFAGLAVGRFGALPPRSEEVRRPPPPSTATPQAAPQGWLPPPPPSALLRRLRHNVPTAPPEGRLYPPSPTPDQRSRRTCSPSPARSSTAAAAPAALIRPAAALEGQARAAAVMVASRLGMSHDGLSEHVDTTRFGSCQMRVRALPGAAIVEPLLRRTLTGDQAVQVVTEQV